MLETLKELCALHGPSGDEGAIRKYILEWVTPYADEIKTDAIGNVMVFRRGNISMEKPLVLAAHMDEVGFIIKKITDEGMLKFGFIGGVDPRVVIGRKVWFGDVCGVVGIKAVHLSTESERKTMPKTKELYIDIGAGSKEEAEKKVSLGQYGSFDAGQVMFGDGLFKSKALDDRFGCAVLLETLKEQPSVDTWFCFTVQEEVGLRGAASMAYALNPSMCLVVEATTAADLPDVKYGKTVCALRGGAVIPFMDGATIYDADLFEFLTELAQARDIAWQTKSRVAGGTDAGRIHKSREGVRVCAVSIPVRYIHSPSSVAALSDIEAACALVQAFVKEIGGNDEQ